MPGIKHLLTFILLLCDTLVWGQTGTYYKYDKNGASCTICIQKKGAEISADIFAWWHTPSGRNGNFSGKGILKNNTCILKEDGGDTDCSVKLSFIPNQVKVVFTDCMEENLPEDFSGTYKKIADIVRGTYTIHTPTAYFYKKPDLKSRSKAYLVKGNQVDVDIENISKNGWVFINYTNAKGKTTSGYLLISTLK